MINSSDLNVKRNLRSENRVIRSYCTTDRVKLQEEKQKKANFFNAALPLRARGTRKSARGY